VKRICVLSLVCASIIMANETVVLEEIVTISTATKTQKKIEGVAASVEVISEKEIQKMGAESLKDILNHTSGINVQYGTFPSASSKSKSSISLRGMGAKGTLFLIDGRRVGGEVANPYDLDRIPASQIEKIEIVKGPMSTLYGADATGGVINIITKKPKAGDTKVDLGVRYGQNSHGDDQNKNANLSIRGKEKALGYSFYVNQTSTTPYTQREVADRANHGGEDKAIFANAMSHYLEWAKALHVKELPCGAMGKNLSIDGLDEKSVCIGDIHAFGEVVLQVSQPRKPCYKISRYWHSQSLTHDIYASGFTGWYYRVLEGGSLQAPQEIQIIQKDPDTINIASANAAFREPSLHPKICEILANHPSLANAWRLDIAKRFRNKTAKKPDYMMQP
jgi:MOSC domain-containing protein YiiM